MQTAIIGSFAYDVVYIHICMGFGFACSTVWAMPEPLCVRLAAKRFPRFFVYKNLSINSHIRESYGILLNNMTNKIITGRVGDKSISRPILFYQADIKEQVLTLQKDIRREFAANGYNEEDVVFD